MTVKRTGLAAAAFLAVLMAAGSAAAQYGPPLAPRERHPQAQNQRSPRGATCVPSGFARLSRNCNVNTGGCQRMPESCSYGWCCP